MNVEELKELSNSTFFDNEQGLINPGEHRQFNNALIDYIQAAVKGAGQAATFVVDSDATLTAWASNTAGNNYTHVLIKPGTFSCSTTINLVTSGTKTVVGMGGNKLIITGTSIGIKSEKGYDCLVMGVNLEMIGTPSAVTFHSCRNVMKCTAKIDGVATGSTQFVTFFNCMYLSHCIGDCTAQNADAYAYYDCQYIENCYGFSYTKTQHNSYTFNQCSNLVNCDCRASGNGYVWGFRNCSNLVNCNVTIQSGGVQTSGFAGCSNLISCKSSVLNVNGQSAYAYMNCYRLTHCGGSGNSSGKGVGYAFSACNCLFGCYSEERNKTAAFDACNMSQMGNTHPVGDTAEGGYNMTLYPL